VSLGTVLLVLLALWILPTLLIPSPEQIPYSRFLNLVERGQVETAAISETTITGTFSDDGQDVDFSTTRPPNVDDQNLGDFLRENGVEFTGQQPSGLISVLISWAPLIILVAIWLFVLRRMSGGGAAGALNLGKRGVKIYDRKDLKTTFADVAGVDEAVEELQEIVEFLANPKKYQRLGGRIPKGVLLMGPPGCGKTLLARAVAGEAGVPFFYMSGSDFVEMFVGLGAARVRELFQQAKEKAPVLIFIDEIDTIGKSRAGAIGGSLGSHDEREQTLTQLLSEMDGFDASKGVIIMAATNRPDVLDPALLRPGRFDRQVVVDRPDLRGREAIFEVHAKAIVLDDDVDLHVLASRTPMLTGADLANIVNEAALLAARREKDAVGMAELEEAIDRVTVGLERRSRVMSDKERELSAVHELGHALVALELESGAILHRITIIPRGRTGGATYFRPTEDRSYMTDREYKDQLARALGGRVAEEIVFEEISTGAHNDLSTATQIARAMVLEFGMSEKIGPISYGSDGFRDTQGRPLFPGADRPAISDETMRIVDEEVARLLDEAHDRAALILDEKKDLLLRLAKVLMERETLEGEELRRMVEGEVSHPDRVLTEHVPTTETLPTEELPREA
jgi:cell division protease FtsH